jgi:hypothetical protein
VVSLVTLPVIFSAASQLPGPDVTGTYQPRVPFTLSDRRGSTAAGDLATITGQVAEAPLVKSMAGK